MTPLTQLKKTEILRRSRYTATLIKRVVDHPTMGDLRQLRKIDSVLYNLELTLEDFLDEKPLTPFLRAFNYVKASVATLGK